MERYICIHGHFYQPPRENPWLEAIEVQDSAYPYHDWNERINVECYAANAASRILDDKGCIVGIVNNYSKLSFNFGPTLLAWMEENAAETYQAVIEADRESRKIFSGHGSALAQAFNHMIMPLASPRDKETQTAWGIADFEHRFGRKPEGMWLPETAVDVETLEVLARQGIRFTVLAPHQAARVRKIGDRDWQDLNGGIDPSRAYLINLPSGAKLSLFFYDGPTSQAVAFERLLSRGEDFANRLARAFSSDRDWTQLSHIATDGETYGHHHKFGNMALSYALQVIESNNLARLTNYGAFLEKFPPTHEVEIVEKSSWSCAHGVERWRTDCGCNTGGNPGWNQAWRAPLRRSLDWLRDNVSSLWETKAETLFNDPWAARNAYIGVLLDRSEQSMEKFFKEHEKKELAESERTAALELMELQRHVMLMYTSCGWFFDDLSGIETIQIIRYAGRVLQISRDLLNKDLEPGFLAIIGEAKSNNPDFKDGRIIYDKQVRPAMLGLPEVGAHYAVSSLFEEYPERADIYCYQVELEDCRREEAGRASLVVGRVKITSRITLASAVMGFGVLHLGDHNLNAGVRGFRYQDNYELMAAETADLFRKADLPAVIRTLDKHFGGATYNLRSLFLDQQRKILGTLLDSALEDGEAALRQFFEYHAPLMRFLVDLGAPLPKAFKNAAEFIISRDLWRSFDRELDLHRIESLMDEARVLRLNLDFAGLGFALQKSMEKMMEEILFDPQDLSRMEQILALIGLSGLTHFEVNLWNRQRTLWKMLGEVYPDSRKKAAAGDEGAAAWIELFKKLGEKLSVRIK